MRWHTKRIIFVTNQKKGNGWKWGQERDTLSSHLKHWIEDEIYSVWETVIKNRVPIVWTSWFSDQSLSAFFRLRELSDLLFCFVFLLTEILEFCFGHLWYSCHIVSVHNSSTILKLCFLWKIENTAVQLHHGIIKRTCTR